MIADIHKIAIFRALQLGDMLCAIPAVRALRTAFPHARITLLGLPWAQALIRRFPAYFDEFVHFPGYPGLPEQPVDPADIPPFLAAIQQQQLDLVLQMHGNGSIVNPLATLMNARFTAGFRKKEDTCFDNGLFITYPEHLPEIARHLALLEHLGIPAQGTDLEFPLYPEDEEAFAQLSFPAGPREYICVHPGSRGSWRQWPPHLFAALADKLADKGYRIVLTGTAEERALTAEVAAMMMHPAIDLAGKTTLGSMAVLVKNARALLSNCTGVSHIAAALKTPSIIISMDGEMHRWAPLDRSIHYTIDWTAAADFEAVLAQGRRLLETTDV